MAYTSNAAIQSVGNDIKTETNIGGNTAARVGGVIEDIGFAFDAKDANVGYYVATLNGGTITATAPNYKLTTGGVIRLKMPAAGTTASTLTIGNASSVALWYNGAAVSSTNTWEANEIISVFYDGTRFMASNSQGGNVDLYIQDALDADLQFADQNGNVLAQFYDGHIRTKYFDSSTDTPVSLGTDNQYDLEFADQNGNVLVRFYDGHIQTKNFNSNAFNSSIKFACLGDSITSNKNVNTGGLIQEILGVQYLAEDTSDSSSAGNCTTEFGNLAVGNATFSDWSTTTIQLTKNTGTTDGKNVVSNQVRRLLQHTTALGAQIEWTHPIDGTTHSIATSYGVGKGYTNDKPDIIYIAAGTNDWGGGRYVDTYDTVITQTYSQLDRLTVCSALRWTVETLQINYPKAKIFVQTPIWRIGFPTEVNTAAEGIRKMCQWLGVQVIDSNYSSGLGRLTMQNGWLSNDGTHPNARGKEVLAEFVAGQIKSGYGKLK